MATDPHIRPDGIWDDNWYQTTGKYGGGDNAGETPTEKLMRTVIEENQKQLKQYQDRFNEYTSKNPFSYDKVLAEETAKVKERLDPYYNQVLGDYIQGANVKASRSLEDERNLLGQLSQSTSKYNQEQKDVLRNSLDSIDQSTGGTVDSGLAARAQGNAVADTQQGLEGYNTQAENKANQTQLEGERYRNYDIPLATNVFKRDTTEEQKYQTQAQALGQEQQKQNQFQFARSEYAGAPPGTDPTQYQNNLYSMLGS